MPTGSTTPTPPARETCKLVDDTIFTVLGRIDLVGNASREVDSLNAKLLATQKGLEKSGAASVNWSRVMVAGGAAVTLAGAGVLTGMYKATEAAGSFNRELEMIHTQAGATQGEVDKMRGAVLALAGPTATAPDELAKGLYHIESAGFPGKTALDALTIAAEGARLGNANLEDVTNAMNAVMVAGVPEASNLAGAMGELNAIVGAGDMRMQDLADAMGTGVLASAKTFGLGLKDVGAALAVFGDNNIRGAEGATKLRMAISMMGAPSGAAAQALGSIGLQSTQLADDMRSPGGLVFAFQDLKKHLDASGLSASQQAQVLTKAFGGGRTSAAVEILLQQIDRLKLKEQEVKDGATKFGEAWAATQEGFSYKQASLNQSMHAFGIAIGEAASPTIISQMDSLSTGVRQVVDGFEKLPKPAQDAAGQMTVYGSETAIASGAMMMFVGVLPQMKAGFGILKGITGVSAGFLGLAGALAVAQKAESDFAKSTASRMAGGGAKGAVAGALAGIAVNPLIGEYNAVVDALTAAVRRLTTATGDANGADSKFTKTNHSLIDQFYGLTSAVSDSAAATGTDTDAMKALAQATDTVRNKTHLLRTAEEQSLQGEVDLHAARRNLNDMTKQYGSKSAEAKLATLQLRDAEEAARKKSNEYKDAQKKVADAQALINQKTADSKKPISDYTKGLMGIYDGAGKVTQALSGIKLPSWAANSPANLIGHGIYAAGTITNGAEMALIGEAGREAVIPFENPKFRTQAEALWKFSGAQMGLLPKSAGDVGEGDGNMAQLVDTFRQALSASLKPMAGVAHNLSAEAKSLGPVGRLKHYLDAQVGKPYVWGASGPNSFDCSGLVSAALSAAGINPDGRFVVADEPRLFSSGAGKSVTIGALPWHHTGIEVMGGWYEAPHTGANVRGPGSARSNWGAYLHIPGYRTGGISAYDELAMVDRGEYHINPSAASAPGLTRRLAGQLGMTDTHHHYNLTINTSAPHEPIAQDFQMMRACSVRGD